MGTIVGIYEESPPFPPEAVHPQAQRYGMHGVEFYAIGGQPDAQDAADKAALVRYAQAHRLKVEQAGFMFNGVRVPTDDHAIILLGLACETLADDEAVVFIDRGINYGEFNGATLRLMRKALAAFITKTFAVLGALLHEIYSDAVSSTQQIDEAAWPA